MKRLAVKSGTSQRTRFLVKSQSTGLGVPGIVFGTSGLTVYYHRAGDTSSTAVTLCAGTLGTYTNQGGTGTGGGWIAVDGTNLPGLYEFSCPDAMWTAGEPILYINVPAGDFCEPCEFQLTGADFTASPGATNALLCYGTGLGQITTYAGFLGFDWGHIANTGTVVSLSATSIQTTGAVSASVTVGANLDKTGYGLAVTPASASALAALATTVGVAGAGLTGIPGVSDPWSAALPGSYGAGSAGAIVGANLNATVSSRSTYAGGAVASVTGNVGGNVAGSVASVTAPVTVGSLTAGAIDIATLTDQLAQVLIRAYLISTGSTTPATADQWGVSGFFNGVVYYKGQNTELFIWFNTSGWTISTVLGTAGSNYWTTAGGANIVGPYTAQGGASGVPAFVAHGNAMLATYQPDLTTTTAAISAGIWQDLLSSADFSTVGSAGAMFKTLALASQIPTNFTTALFASAGVFSTGALANVPAPSLGANAPAGWINAASIAADTLYDGLTVSGSTTGCVLASTEPATAGAIPAGTILFFKTLRQWGIVGTYGTGQAVTFANGPLPTAVGASTPYVFDGFAAGYSLAPAGLDAIVVETGVNARQALSPILAASAGVLLGAGTGTIVIKGGNVATTRITATTDNSGNRTAITLVIPA